MGNSKNIDKNSTIKETLPQGNNIVPVKVEEYVTDALDIDLPLGMVYLVPIDENGAELTERGFTTSLKDYNRYYNNRRFALKKKGI